MYGSIEPRGYVFHGVRGHRRAAGRSGTWASPNVEEDARTTAGDSGLVARRDDTRSLQLDPEAHCLLAGIQSNRGRCHALKQ